MKNSGWQTIAAKNDPIEWTGDLNDDCTARWAGLLLRAEEMERNSWWWAVTDLERNIEIGSSNESNQIPKSGKAARSLAEKTAKRYLGGTR